MRALIALGLAGFVVFASTILHYEAIHRLDIFARHRRAYPALLGVIAGLIGLHMTEIGLYAGLFALADGPLALGDFRGARLMGTLDYVYFAAEAYASLGYGDVYPTGEMRLIGSVAPLNGILLLAWSGSFLFSLVQDWRANED
ncbi:ion channel [Phenylobacterium sp.]|uniref:ion channel n=1 Tax=Phenylobacterium sp. TaxID=1871053 RepID=UPI002F412DA4